MARAMKAKVTQAHLHAIIARMIGNGVSGRVEGQFGCFLLFSVKNVNDLGPGGFLAVIDFPQIEQVPLHPSSVSWHLFSDAPITMVFSVLEAVMTLQKWFGHNNGSELYSAAQRPKRGWVCTKRKSGLKSLDSPR